MGNRQLGMAVTLSEAKSDFRTSWTEPDPEIGASRPAPSLPTRPRLPTVILSAAKNPALPPESRHLKPILSF